MVEADIIEMPRRSSIADGSSVTASAAQVRELLRRAVLTLAAVPDTQAHFLAGLRSKWPQIVQSAQEAYGYSPARIRKFQPTPRDVSIYLDVLAWLTWYEHERDAEQAALVVAWALDVPSWRLEARFRKSERTLRRWVDEVATVIAHQFHDDVEKILLDECHECPPKSAPNQYSGESAPDDDPPTKSPTVWIAEDAKTSLDMSNPAVAASRQELIDRLERQNRKREQAKAREQERRRR